MALSTWYIKDAFAGHVNSIVTLSLMTDVETGSVFYRVTCEYPQGDRAPIFDHRLFDNIERARDWMKSLRNDAEAYGTETVTQA